MMENNKPSKRRQQPFARFSLEEYKKNPEIIKRANDKQLDYFEKVLLPENHRLIIEKRKIERENLLLTKEISAFKKRIHVKSRISILQSFLMIVGAILIGYGVNLISSLNSSDSSSGAVLLIIGILVSLWGVFSIFITRS